VNYSLEPREGAAKMMTGDAGRPGAVQDTPIGGPRAENLRWDSVHLNKVG